jgi:hypothetical protein
MDRPMAEAIVEGIAATDTSELAAKADFGRLESATKAEIGRLESAMKADFARLEAKIDTSIAELRAEMFRFMMLQAVTIVGLTVTLIKLLP